MKISRVVAEYLTFKRSTGMRYRSGYYKLNAFSRRVGDVEIERVKPNDVLSFLNGQGPVTAQWHDKFIILKGFYRFAISRRYVASCPLPIAVPKRPPAFVPHIYSSKEIRGLLDATNVLASKRSPRERTFKTLLLTLYATGLRISEALALTLDDVNLSEQLLRVRESKFYKSRLVPIGPKLAEELRRYLELRSELDFHGKGDPFFATRRGRRLSYGHVQEMFTEVRAEAGVRRIATARYQPRLHDLRHTFAIRRLVTWYREGADVQRLLPKLSTYLGHVDIAATQRYLQMTPELLQEANRRFENYAALEVSHD